MSALIRSFKVANGSVVHLVHEGKSNVRRDTYWSVCGKVFDRAQVMSTKATCALCIKRDDPFAISPAQIAKLARIDEGKMRPGEDFSDLVQRDLITGSAGTLTVRGRLLIEDLLTPAPWPDDAGVMHGRSSAARARALCGASLWGVKDVTFATLNRMLAAGQEQKVNCISCIVDA